MRLSKSPQKECHIEGRELVHFKFKISRVALKRGMARISDNLEFASEGVGVNVNSKVYRMP
jgi:hypothetical protein